MISFSDMIRKQQVNRKSPTGDLFILHIYLKWWQTWASSPIGKDLKMSYSLLFGYYLIFSLFVWAFTNSFLHRRPPRSSSFSTGTLRVCVKEPTVSIGRCQPSNVTRAKINCALVAKEIGASTLFKSWKIPWWNVMLVMGLYWMNRTVF